MSSTTTEIPSNTHPLCLMMPVKPGAFERLELLAALAKAQSQITDALNTVGTVHFARFVLFDLSQPNLKPHLVSKGPFVISVITEYDGDFSAYLRDFVDQLGDVFNTLLGFVVGGENYTPVQQNPEKFANFVAENDLQLHDENGNGVGLYAAYPYTVNQIKAKFRT